MDPHIALNPSLGPAILAALRSPAGDAQVQSLRALVGERVDLVLLSAEGNTVKLQLPNGQVIEAEGELPYPPGTRLTVQVLPPGSGQSAPRLKLVEAVPPPPLPILSPLQQGEARQLLVRLTAAEPPPELVALARLFAALGAEEAATRTLRDPRNVPGSERTAEAEAKAVATSPEQAPKSGPASPSVAPAEPPSIGRIVAMLRELPPAVLRDLQRALFPGAAPSLEDTAEALRGLLRSPETSAEPATEALKDFLLLLLRSAQPDAAVRTAGPVPKAISATLLPDPQNPIEVILRDLPPTVFKDLQRALFPAASTPPSLAEMAGALRTLGEAIAIGRPVPEPEAPFADGTAILAKSADPRFSPAVEPRPLPGEEAPAPTVPKEASAKPADAGAGAAEGAVKRLRNLQESLFRPTPPSPADGAADPALAPLKNLLQSLLKPAPEPGRRAVADSTARASTPTALPTTGRIVALLRELPPAVLLEFQRIVFAGSPASHSLPELAEALRGLLQTMEPPPSPRPAAAAGPPSLSAARQVPGETVLAKVLLGVQEALSVPVQPLPTFAFQGGDPAMEPLKNLLLFLLRPSYLEGSAGPALADLLARAVRTSAGGADAPAPESGSALDSNRKHAAIQGRPSETTQGPELSSRNTARLAADRLPDLRRESAAAAQQASAEPPAAAAKSWESWLSAGVRTLSDPLASPREAPFHLAQAKEGTAFFELPLPWDGGKAVQLWVESDAGGGSRENGDRTRRVLVGLHFSALGETRVGIVVSGDRLQVRVWTEHPELLRDREAAIRLDLADLGPDLDLQVLALGEPGESIPSLRALADGSGFHALG